MQQLPKDASKRAFQVPHSSIPVPRWTKHQHAAAVEEQLRLKDEMFHQLVLLTN